MSGHELSAIQDHLATLFGSPPEIGGPSAAFDRVTQLPHDTLVALVMANTARRAHELDA